jgi:hypothetical protein
MAALFVCWGVWNMWRRRECRDVPFRCHEYFYPIDARRISRPARAERLMCCGRIRLESWFDEDRTRTMWEEIEAS